MASVEDNTNQTTPQKQGLWRTTKSILWAFLGVQSRKNWEEDMQSPSPAQFMIVGAVMGFGLVVVLGMVTWAATSRLLGQ